MKKQLSNHCDPYESFKDQADAEGKPPGVPIHGRERIHSVKCKFLNCFVGKIGKENWELLMQSTPPEYYRERGLENVRPDPKIVPEE
jgi:hypothetical protein